MEANFDVLFGDFEDIRGIGRAHFLYVAQHENGSVSVRRLFDRFFQQPAMPLKPGTYQLRLGVMDRLSGRTGTLDVPLNLEARVAAR
jgi:hypothetical protein